MSLPPAFRPVLDALLAGHPAGAAITIDAVADAIGTRVAGYAEVDALITALERAGRTVSAPAGARGVASLRAVLASARALQSTLGRAPSSAEIAQHSGLSREDVQHALALARVMQR